MEQNGSVLREVLYGVLFVKSLAEAIHIPHFNADKLVTQVDKVYSNNYAYAALKENGTVVTWGNSQFGGDSSGVQAHLEGVKAIYSTPEAFAALKEDGTVVAWGNPFAGGDISAVQSQLTDVKEIYASKFGFVALKNDKTLISWSGDGQTTSFTKTISQVKSVFPAHDHFVVLKENQDIEAWGSREFILKNQDELLATDYIIPHKEWCIIVQVDGSFRVK